MYIPDELLPKVYPRDSSGRLKPTVPMRRLRPLSNMDRAEKVKAYYDEALDKLALALWWANEAQDGKV